MYRIVYLFVLLCITSSSVLSVSYKDYFYYVDPLPGSEMINPETGIIIKPGLLVDKNTLVNGNAFTVTGSASGTCRYQIIKCSDGVTHILKPEKPFMLGETVKIEYSNSIKTKNGNSIKPFSYTFKIKASEVKVNRQNDFSSELRGQAPFLPFSGDASGFPDITLKYYDNPSPGRIFMTTFNMNPAVLTNYIIILNNDGSVFYSQQMPDITVDFNMQYNGNLTYFTSDRGLYEEIDEYYSVVDEFRCGNGYGTDLHELRVLENRHAYLMSYDSQQVDMSQILPGGNPNAVVSGLIIQEIDENKNVVFQWRSWDHFQITDAWHENMYSHAIDAVHGNAIEIDFDGNIMISSRHLDEITKINRTTGNVMWRLGGKNNQFTFINDNDKFNYQHAIRKLDNGNIILYDNGNFHTPPYSRAVEYRLDVINMTAELVWQYRNSPDVFGPAMGSAFRQPNGNTIIGWGLTPAMRTAITEARPDGSKAFEMDLPPGIFSYRIFKYNYKMNEYTPLYPPQSIFLGQNFPNPFNPKTKIKFGLPRLNGITAAMDVKLTVYDMLGREIARLVDAPLKPYEYEVEFDGSGLSSGIYFYTITAAGDNARYYETKKMILIK